MMQRPGPERFGLLVGRSPSMLAVFDLLERAAANDVTVLLEGETGTGKEIAAESIHRRSRRRAGPFVVFDCSAVPPDLIESELFGHEKGAFTGAVTAREGAFKRAAGGTIFLDEIGELGSELQPKLLRALERSEVKPVGGDRYTRVDVRVVAATNRNLRTEVEARRFRADLYYRLAVVVVELPPLRERLADLPLLIECILRSLGREDECQLRDPQWLAELRRHSWPGNVRELRNHVERVLALGENRPPALERPTADGLFSLPLRTACREFERHYLEEMLRLHGGSVSAAARAAQMDRAFFYRLLRRHGLRSAPAR
jgi:two-component system, NtrC family, response regulator GlrR